MALHTTGGGGNLTESPSGLDWGISWGLYRPPFARLLSYPRLKISEIDRFWRYVVKGPNTGDCWIWIGATGDDGYGRFWTSTENGQRVLRPQRFLYRELTGIDLPANTMLLHNCDIPLCVHVTSDPNTSHLRVGGAKQNQADTARAGRHRNRFTTERFASLPRAERAARSRRLRDTVRAHGWDPLLIARALSDAGSEHPTLF